MRAPGIFLKSIWILQNNAIRRGFRKYHQGVYQMKVVLFCGGLGTRIREYSENIPKPMVPVGHQPILWHIMQYYSDYGHRDFVLCLGYKANVIKDYILNYKPTAASDCIISDFGNKVELLGARPPDWRVTLVGD